MKSKVANVLSSPIRLSTTVQTLKAQGTGLTVLCVIHSADLLFFAFSLYGRIMRSRGCGVS